MTEQNNDIFEIFPWHKNFDTGIEIIDEQHRVLVDILNKLAAHLANRSDNFILNEIFDELADYADYHFQTEGKIWEAAFKDDIWFTSHEKTHDSFITEVLDLKKEDKKKPLNDVILDVVSFLTKWLAYHILDTDKRMAIALKLINSGSTIEEAKERSNKEMSGSMQVLINTVLAMYDNLSSRTMELMREKALRKQAEAALTLSEERWSFILEGGSAGVWDWNIEQQDASHHQENDSFFSHSDDISLETGHETNIHPDDIDRVKADFQAHLEGKTDFYINKHRVLRNNHWYWVLSRGKVVSRDEFGHAQRMVGTNTDVTEHELAMLIYRYSTQGMFITDSYNKIISINPAFTIITGYLEADVLDKNPSCLASGKHDANFFQQMWHSINTKGNWEGEIWNRRKNGEIYPETLSINRVTDDDGFMDHHLALFTDITDKKKADELIYEHANYDPLTKLANRYLFKQNLQHEIYKSIRSKLRLALLFIDLDHFKDVNDANGHDVGDRLLIEVAQRISSCVRMTDAVARLGGDEYTVILTDLRDTHIIERITLEIIDSLQQPFQIDDCQVYISASIGITIYPDDASEIVSMLKYADQAMYKAKSQGRNCYSFFNKAMQEEALALQKLTKALRAAISENQLEVYYQPIIERKTGNIYKAEALLRWNHPKHGMISPAEFIPLAEKSGLIIEIGDWVFRQVAQQLKIWIKKFGPDFQISINKSPIQFQPKHNHTGWLTYLSLLGLSGKNLTVEITEGLLLEDDAKIMEQLVEFHEAGVQISIDDFGTGYSSLSYIKKFDIDYLKIDQSFIRSLTSESEDMAIPEAIIVMAHKLGLKVIAEGVETEHQLQLLTQAGCDYLQGYLFSKPISAGNFEQMLLSYEPRILD